VGWDGEEDGFRGGPQLPARYHSETTAHERVITCSSHYQCHIDQVWFISRPSSPPESFPLANRHRPRMASDTSLGSPVLSWVELPNSLLEHTRTRPASVSRQTEDGKEAIVNGNGEHTLSSRPGILRSHNHSSSNQIQGASIRALRIEVCCRRCTSITCFITRRELPCSQVVY